MELENIKGIGPKMKQLLENLGINSVENLVEYYPYRYNFIHIKNLEDFADDSGYLRCYVLTEPKIAFIKKNFNKLSFLAEYKNMQFTVIIFNRAFMKSNIKPNKELVLVGKYDRLKNTFIASDIKFSIPNNGIESIYHLTQGITSNILSKLIKKGLAININYCDLIPEEYNQKYKLIDKKLAIQNIHFPKNINDIKISQLKLIYEEFFQFMFKINYLKMTKNKTVGLQRRIDLIQANKFLDLLEFTLTSDQETVIKEIYEDMISTKRMNRLVLGDVGSGKTIVASYAIYINWLSQYQTAFMVPTEILAVQHFNSLKRLFNNTNINIEILTGRMSKKEKTNIYKRLENKEIDLIIGTHALINDELHFSNLGLVITDEQHRFGVLQRNNLENKGQKPDILYLSATPIPRTYALTIYGDTDISIIRIKPKGRKEIITKVYKESEIKDVLKQVYSEIQCGHQIFAVSPLIENEESTLNSVVRLKEKLNNAFKNSKIEIIHGKMKQEQKDGIMNNFLNKQIDILISTTVIEVGIDVPNATVMVIYNAERFGLATLHQLRGRVGRGEDQSYCFLISDFDNQRLKVMEESNDGFYITEKDFEQRREGDLFGTKQSGDMIFKIGDIKRDYKILLQAQKDSEEYIKNQKYKNNNYYLQRIDELDYLI